MSSSNEKGTPVPAEGAPLDEAYVQSHGDLLRFLSNRLRCLTTARDVAQETYLRASQSEAAINEPRAFLFRTAANLATDAQRAQRRHEEILSEAASWLEPDPAASAESVALMQDELERVTDAIDRLPPRCREVFYLNRFEGLSQSDIAARLGISMTAVEKSVKRALSALMEARGEK